MQPYGETTRMLVLLCVVGVSLYFITSSDSGSYVDDILAANGMPNPPPLQKVFWAFTEGAVATGLIKAGGDVGLSALQAVSICAGLPYTFALCFLCTSVWRGLKIDQGEADVCAAAQWSHHGAWYITRTSRPASRTWRSKLVATSLCGRVE